MNANTTEFSPAQLRRLVSDLYTPSPFVYWTDFLVSICIGYAAALVYLWAPLGAWWQVVAWLLAVVALYRVAMFMHEIVHFKREQMRAFRVTYDLLAGVFMLIPSFLYESHIAHHNTHHYGTGRDGEYLPLGNGPLRNLLFFLMQVFVLPAMVVVRFAVLTPLSFLHPSLRQWVLEYASSFVINFKHRREIPPDAPRRYWALIEWLCCLRTWAIFVGPAVGLVPWKQIPLLYFLAVSILTLNHLRTLAAHRYRSTGEEMSHQEQFFDSTIITGHPVWTEILCPLGLRYHALHHLFPSLPYHNLGKAHRRIVASVPADSPYHDVVYPSAWAVVRELIHNARQEARRRPCGADRWYQARRRQWRRVEESAKTGAASETAA